MHPHYTIKFQWVHWGPVVSLNWCQTPPCGSICWETSLSYFLNNIFFPFCTLDLLHRLIYEFGSLFYPKQLMLHSGYIFFYFHAILGNQNHGCGIASIMLYCLNHCNVSEVLVKIRERLLTLGMYCHTFRNAFHISTYLSFLFVIVFLSQKCNVFYTEDD